METILSILIPFALFALAFWATNLLTASSRFAPRYRFDAEVEDNFPELKEGYRWRPQRALILNIHRVYVQKKTWYGWKPVEWGAFVSGSGDMKTLRANPDLWWRQGSGTLASSMGHLLECNPYLLPNK